MASVTKRISEIAQPRGGYVNLNDFEVKQFENITECWDISKENIHPTIVGMATDYLTRFYLTNDAESAFEISLMGAELAEELFGVKGAKENAQKLLNEIKDINVENDKRVIATCKLVTYDVYKRNPAYATADNGPDSINPNRETIENISIMVARTTAFWNVYGPIVKDGFTFEGGYTDTIDSGDGDYMTDDTIWDMKVSKSKPTPKHTLQLIVYWRMGLESLHKEFQKIKYVGIFNPRLNTVYRYELKKLSKETIKEIDSYVIGY